MASNRYNPGKDPRNLPLSRRLFLICPECGKVGYPSKATAKKAGRLNHPGTPMRAYKCGEWWHLTSLSTATVTAYREYERGEA